MSVRQLLYKRRKITIEIETSKKLLKFLGKTNMDQKYSGAQVDQPKSVAMVTFLFSTSHILTM